MFINSFIAIFKKMIQSYTVCDSGTPAAKYAAIAIQILIESKPESLWLHCPVPRTLFEAR